MSYGNKTVLNPLLKAVINSLSAEFATFKAHYIVKLRRYESMNVIEASVRYMNSSVMGIRPF